MSSRAEAPSTDDLVREQLYRAACATDRLFARLLIAEWVVGFALSLWLSPYTVMGSARRLHPHLLAALLLGGLSAAPAMMVRRGRGQPLSRHAIAVGQMVMCGLYVHLTGGRIETHFMIFGSLAFLAFYRDPSVLLSALVVVLIEHSLRTIFYPESVFGVRSASLFRVLEHALWLFFEVFFLVLSCRREVRSLRALADRHAALHDEHRRARDAEEALSGAYAELERRVAERTVELRAAKEAAEAASRAKTEFLANVSHEIRTPLAAVQGYAELLLGDRAPQAQQRAYVETILRSGQHLLAMLGNILDLTKIEAGKMSVEAIPCAPGAVLLDVTSLMRARALEKRLEFEVRYVTPVPETISTDPTRLSQILLNLVGNAIKFTAAGSVRVLVACEAPGSPEPRLRIEVIDTGIGLSPEQVERLFQPFTQADASTTRRFGGTGLGLIICRRLAMMLGGSLTVTSEAGRGSTFTLEIPTGSLQGTRMLARLDEGMAPPSLLDAPREEIRVAGTILLAEDGTDNQFIVATFLRRAGATVTVVENGRLAVEVALAARSRGEPFNLIFMDMAMPEVDGYQATAMLREAHYEGPIVALTAHAMSSDRDKCLAAGCTDFLTKPVRRAQLIEMAARYLQVRHSATPSPLYSDFTGDPELEELVTFFVGELPERIRLLTDAMEHGDRGSLATLAHQLKGAGGAYGFPSITESARALEDALGGGEGIEARTAELITLCGRACQGPSASNAA